MRSETVIKKKIDGEFKNAYIFGEIGTYKLKFENGVLLEKNAYPKGKSNVEHYFYPPFIDTHNHFMAYSILQMSVMLHKARSIEEIKDTIIDFIKKKHPKFVLAEGWDENFLKEGRLIDKSDLNSISNTIPIFARRIDGHITIINDAGIEYLNKMGLYIDNNILLEENSLNLSNYLYFSKEDINEGFNRAVNIAYSLGVIGCADFVTGHYYNYYRQLEYSGNFKNYYYNMLPFELNDPMENKNLKYMGIKLFIDGSIGANTAMTSFPYLNGVGNGMLLYEDLVLKKTIEEHLNEKEQIAIHAIGDIAVSQLLHLIDTIKSPNKKNIRLEHLEFIKDKDLELIQKNDLMVSMQPNFIQMWGMKNGMYEKKFGNIYIKNNRLNTISQFSSLFAFGSDNMPFSPSYGIYSARNHPDINERPSFEDAIKYYSFNAYKMLNEKIEFLKTGEMADCLIYNDKPNIQNGENFLNPDITVHKGELVHGKN
ncbi:amidohydrolase family protein [bacterium]|nr:amidohydrolase family protein [bacterium]